MAYGNVHRFLLRSVASQGVLSVPETITILNSFTGNEVDANTIETYVEKINEKIIPLQQRIKIAIDEVTSEKKLVFLSLGYDDATKSQNVFSTVELDYFRVLLEQIMTVESRQITSIHAVNLASNVKLNITNAEKILDVWCKLHYLDKIESNYALGIRAIHEFEGYLQENMPDTIETCHLCKKIVFRGYNCPGCAKAIHTRCLNLYLEKVQKWPCCGAEFNQAQLERLNSDVLTQTQRLEVTQEVDCTNPDTMDVCNDSLSSTQPLIRGRKRKRN